jgi:hypothetical protein
MGGLFVARQQKGPEGGFIYGSASYEGAER